MGKPLKQLIRRTVYAGKGNLMALDEPYPTLARLLGDHAVTNVVDAGASTGTVSKRLSRWFDDARFHLFEPHPDYAQPLAELGRDQRFTVTRAALGEEEGELTLFLTSERGPTSRYRPNDRSQALFGRRVAVEREVRVPMTTLDSWAARERPGDVQLLKLDIQSGELAALRGASGLLRTQVLAVYTEISFSPMYEGGAVWADVDAQLRGCGFILHNLYKPAADHRDTLIQANAIYVHPGRLGW